MDEAADGEGERPPLELTVAVALMAAVGDGVGAYVSCANVLFAVSGLQVLP